MKHPKATHLIDFCSSYNHVHVYFCGHAANVVPIRRDRVRLNSDCVHTVCEEGFRASLHEDGRVFQATVVWDSVYSMHDEDMTDVAWWFETESGRVKLTAAEQQRLRAAAESGAPEPVSAVHAKLPDSWRVIDGGAKRVAGARR